MLDLKATRLEEERPRLQSEPIDGLDEQTCIPERLLPNTDADILATTKRTERQQRLDIHNTQAFKSEAIIDAIIPVKF